AVNLRSQPPQVIKRCADNQLSRPDSAWRLADFGIDFNELARELPDLNKSPLSDRTLVIRYEHTPGEAGDRECGRGERQPMPAHQFSRPVPGIALARA